MEKINVYICVNDYKISTVGTISDGIISCCKDSLRIDYDINNKMLIKEDSVSKIVINFEKCEMNVSLKDYDGFFINNIVLKSYSCDNNRIEIEYLIDEKLYNLLIMYKTCEKCLQND